MKKAEFDEKYECIYEEQYDAFDLNKLERSLLFQIRVQNKANPAVCDRFPVKIPINKEVVDFKLSKGEEEYQKFLERTIQNQINTKFNIIEE